MVIFCILLVLTGMRVPNKMVHCSLPDERSLPLRLTDSDCDECDCGGKPFVNPCRRCCLFKRVLGLDIYSATRKKHTTEKDTLFPTIEELLGLDIYSDTRKKHTTEKDTLFPTPAWRMKKVLGLDRYSDTRKQHTTEKDTLFPTPAWRMKKVLGLDIYSDTRKKHTTEKDTLFPTPAWRMKKVLGLDIYSDTRKQHTTEKDTLFPTPPWMIEEIPQTSTEIYFTNKDETLIHHEQPKHLEIHERVGDKSFNSVAVFLYVMVSFSLICIVLRVAKNDRPDSDRRQISNWRRNRPHYRTNRLTVTDRHDDVESQYPEQSLCTICLNDELPPTYEDVCNAWIHADSPTCSITLHHDFGHGEAFDTSNAANGPSVDDRPPSYEEANIVCASVGRTTGVDFPTPTPVDRSRTAYNCIQCTTV